MSSHREHHRDLQSVDAVITSKIADLIKVELIPSPESDPKMLGFSWALGEANPGEFKMQLEFEHPEVISSKIDNDRLRITV